jgi:hypothetical protein
MSFVFLYKNKRTGLIYIYIYIQWVDRFGISPGKTLTAFRFRRDSSSGDGGLLFGRSPSSNGLSPFHPQIILIGFFKKEKKEKNNQ